MPVFPLPIFLFLIYPPEKPMCYFSDVDVGSHSAVLELPFRIDIGIRRLHLGLF